MGPLDAVDHLPLRCGADFQYNVVAPRPIDPGVRVMIRALTLAAIAALATSCTFARAEINDPTLPQRLAEGLVIGETTEDELIEAIGTPPGQIILLKDRERLLIYNYGQSRTKGFTLIIFNAAKTNVAVDSAVFLIGSNGRVKEAWIGDNSEDVPFEWWPFGD